MDILTGWTPKEIVTLTVAVTSIILSYYSSRRLTKLQHKLEKEKEYTKRWLDVQYKFLIEGRDREFLAFQEIISQIQLVRDKIRELIYAPSSKLLEKRYDKNTLTKELNLLKEELCNRYAIHQISFTEEEDRKKAHSVKRDCEYILNELSEIIDTTKKDANIPQDIFAKIKDITQGQTELREREKKAQEKLKNLIENKVEQIDG